MRKYASYLAWLCLNLERVHITSSSHQGNESLSILQKKKRKYHKTIKKTREPATEISSSHFLFFYHYCYSTLYFLPLIKFRNLAHSII